MTQTFEESLLFGEEGEHVISKLLMQRGVVVQPLYQHSTDHAPHLLWEMDGRVARAVLPDLTCWGRRQFFAEVKRKTRWIRFVADRVETGANARLIDDYLAVSKRTRAQVWLFFLHEKQEPTGVYYGELGALMPHARHWDGRDARNGGRICPPMTLFPLSQLQRLVLE